MISIKRILLELGRKNWQRTMNFVNPTFRSLLASWTASVDVRERAEAHNIKFEEKLDRDRLGVFEVFCKTPCATPNDLRRHLQDFVMTYIEVAPPHIPLTFIENPGPALRLISPEQKLVRIENITRHLANSNLAIHDLHKSLSSTKTSSLAIADSFVDQWNIARDARPSFAAFKDQLLEEIDDADWPHKIRDRLGLTHYSSAGGRLAVALMEYTVEEVLHEAAKFPAIRHPFCAPTFLDSKQNPQFFPTPSELPAGSPMALLEIWSDEQLIELARGI